VIVVGPSPDGRRAGARPTWLLGVLDRATVADIVAWVRGGGPGIADPPPVVDLRVFTPGDGPADSSAMAAEHRAILVEHVDVR
jgi:hypothetical protein